MPGEGIRPAVWSKAAAIQTQYAPEKKGGMELVRECLEEPDDPSPTHEGSLKRTVTLTAKRSLKQMIKSKELYGLFY